MINIKIPVIFEERFAKSMVKRFYKEDGYIKIDYIPVKAALMKLVYKRYFALRKQDDNQK